MKAPDKIYIHRTFHLGLLSASEIDITGQDEQYIRKDTLLEWVKEIKRICKGAEPIEKAYQTVIDKIESL